jgi:hypothetical protein
MTRRDHEHPLLVLGASVLVSLLLLRNHVLPLGAIPQPGGDYGLMAWNLWVVNESITHGRSPLRTDLIYHPIGASLARHTLVAGLFPLTFATQQLARHDPRYPLYAYRVSILACFTLALGLTYLALRRLGAPPLASAAPALQYAFSPFARLHIPHLNHLAAAFLLPLVTLALLRLWRQPRPLAAAAVGLVLAAAVYFSELTAFLYLALLLAVVWAVVVPSARAALLARARALGLFGAACGLAAFAAAFAPFAAGWASDEGRAPRARQAANWSANAAGFVIPDPVQTPVYRGPFAAASAWASAGIGGREVFLGFPMIVFAGIGLARSRLETKGLFAFLALVFLVLSLGPLLKVGPATTSVSLPYAWLMAVPPFEFGRTPVRCVLFALFALAPLAACGLAWASPSVGRFGPLLAVAALLCSLAEAWGPAPPAPSYHPPAALAQLVPGPVVNVPISVFDGAAVLLQIFHGHPIATGFVSRRTPAQLGYVRSLDLLLNRDPAAFVAYVRSIGFSNVILGPGTPRELAQALAAQPINVVDVRRGDEPPPPRPADESDSTQ